MNGIKREYRGRLNVVFVSLDRSDGRRLAKQYEVVGTPTILFLDREGSQVNVLRGALPAQLIKQAAEELLAQ